MKNLVALVGLIASVSSFASEPKVTCSGMAYKTDSFGVTVLDSIERVDAVTVNRATKPVMIGEVVLNSKLRQICATDGGPCSDSYELITSLKINDSESGTTSIISPSTDKDFRQHLNLNVGDKSVFVNCDKE